MCSNHLQIPEHQFSKEFVEGIVRLAVRQMKANDGFSIAIHGGTLAKLEDGFMVSLRGHEVRIQDDCKVNLCVPIIEEHFKHLMRYVDGEELVRSFYFGGWVEDGHWYFDLSICLYDLESALSLARAERQKAIYDNKTGATLKV